MNNKHINDAFDVFSPTSQQHANVFNALTSGQEVKKQKKRISFGFKVAMSTACCILFLSFAAIPLLNNSKNLTSESQQVKNPVFNGFVLNAYAASNENEYITPDYKNKLVTTEMVPGVKILLPQYSLAMNSVPGLPFSFGFNSKDEKSIKADKMVIEINNGQLLSWNIETGVVTSNGMSVTFSDTTTLYWSPINESKDNINNPLVIPDSTTIRVIAIKDDKEIGEQKININRDGGIYYAICEELIVS